MNGNPRYNGCFSFEEWKKQWHLEDRYNFRAIEDKWQKIWKDEGVRPLDVSAGDAASPDVQDAKDAYGRDVCRLSLLLDKSGVCTDENLTGAYRFVNKVFALFDKVRDNAAFSENDLQEMHGCIKKVSERAGKAKFNIAAAALMAYVNYLSGKKEIAPELYQNLIILLRRFTPHLAEEMWARLGNSGFVEEASFPQFDDGLLQSALIPIVVQINGKVRGTINLPRGASQSDLETAVSALSNVQNYVKQNRLKKIIIIPDRVVSIVTG